MELTGDEKNRIYQGLHVWANFIETGDPSRSAIDIERSRDHELEKRYGRVHVPKALTTEQMREIVALRDLAARFL